MDVDTSDTKLEIPSTLISNHQEDRNGVFTQTWHCHTTCLLPKMIDSEDTAVVSGSTVAPVRVQKIHINCHIMPAVWCHWTTKPENILPTPSLFSVHIEPTVKGGEFEFSEIPKFKTNWLSIYHNTEDLSRIMRSNKQFSFLVLEWFNLFAHLQRKQAETVEQKRLWDITIDPYTAQFLKLHPQAIMQSGGGKRFQKHYTVALQRGFFPIPSFNSPMFPIILGGRHNIISASSMDPICDLTQILYTALDVKKSIYPETFQAKVGNEHDSMLEKIQNWYKDTLKELIATHHRVLFTSAGSFFTTIDIQQAFSDLGFRMCVRKFIVEYSMFQQEYYRRFANLIEITCYNIFFGLPLWNESIKADLMITKFGAYVDMEPIHYPNFGQAHHTKPEHELASTKKNDDIQTEASYFGLENRKAKKWIDLLTPNFQTLLKYTTNDHDIIAHTGPNLLRDSKNQKNEIHKTTCSSTIMNVILALSQMVYHYHTGDPTKKRDGYHHYLFKFAEKNYQSQIQSVVDLLGMVVSMCKEKKMPYESSPEEPVTVNYPANLFKPTASYTRHILGQFMDLYTNRDNTKLRVLLHETQSMLQVTPNDVHVSNLWDKVDPAITVCFGGFSGEKAAQIYWNDAYCRFVSTGSSPDGFILPYCAILHVQSMFLQEFIL